MRGVPEALRRGRGCAGAFQRQSAGSSGRERAVGIMELMAGDTEQICCRCDDGSLRELEGDAAIAYRQHLSRIEQQRGGQAWLMRCPQTGQESVEDIPAEFVVRLRKMPEFWNSPSATS